MISGVWFGARTFLNKQHTYPAHKKTGGSYITQTERKAPKTAESSNEEFYARHKEQTETLDIAKVAPKINEIDLVMERARFAMNNGLTDDAIKMLEALYKRTGDKEVGIALVTAYIKASQTDKAQNMLNALHHSHQDDKEIENLLKTLTD